MQHRDVVAWTAMIQAYSIHGQTTEALQLFKEMKTQGIVPNEFTYSIILSVLAEQANLHEGQQIHEQLKVNKE
jgi:pentatricopeptide repeat protein